MAERSDRSGYPMELMPGFRLFKPSLLSAKQPEIAGGGGNGLRKHYIRDSQSEPETGGDSAGLVTVDQDRKPSTHSERDAANIDFAESSVLQEVRIQSVCDILVKQVSS